MNKAQKEIDKVVCRKAVEVLKRLSVTIEERALMDEMNALNLAIRILEEKGK